MNTVKLNSRGAHTYTFDAYDKLTKQNVKVVVKARKFQRAYWRIKYDMMPNDKPRFQVLWTEEVRQLHAMEMRHRHPMADMRRSAAPLSR